MVALTNNRCVNFILMVLTDITNLHCSLNKVSWEREYGDITDCVPVKLTLYQYKWKIDLEIEMCHLMNPVVDIYQNNLEITKDAILKELKERCEEKQVKFNLGDVWKNIYMEDATKFRVEQVINLEIGELQ